MAKRGRKYAYEVFWSEKDETWIAKVKEQQLLAAHGATPGQALREIMKVVRYAAEDIKAEEHLKEPSS